MSLQQVDASFLAGECDPAIIARLDDVVRANAASAIRNLYVRNAGGVRTRPGMRVRAQFEGRQITTEGAGVGVTVQVRQQGQAGGNPGLAEVPLIPPVRFIPQWDAAGAVVVEIDLGAELEAGTRITVSLANEAQAPEGWVTRLYWWEEAQGNTPTADYGRWRTGGGLVPGRESWEDLLYVDSTIPKEFVHTLTAPASKVRIWRRLWNAGDAAPGPALPNAYGLVLASLAVVKESAIASGERPPVRLLNTTWFPGYQFLLALHGGHATVWQYGRLGPDSLEEDPHSFEGSNTGFTRAQVLSMQAHRTPDGVLLHSPEGSSWQPQRLAINEVGALALEEMTITPPGSFQRSGRTIPGWGPAYVPTAMLAYQGRLLVAGTDLVPNGVWASELGSLTNFLPPVYTDQREQEATDAFMVREVGRPLNRILAMHGGRGLVFFGDRGISFLDRQFVAGTDFGFSENSERGIKRGVPPVEIGTGILAFVDSSGQSVWQMTYANERQGYILNELSQVAPHLLRDPVDLVWYEGLPEGATALLVVNADGSIACCSIQPEGNWHAWSLWESDDVLDVEPFAGGLWAVTRRGDSQKALYLEQYDPELELDFCHASEDGTHPWPTAYPTWSVVAEMKDGTRKRFGMGLEEERDALRRFRRKEGRSPNKREREEIEREALETLQEGRFFSGEVAPAAGGVKALAADARLAGLDVDDVVRWQVGQPFSWKLCTMPFVKRTQRGTAFQALTRTVECFVNVEGTLDLVRLEANPFYLLNRRRMKPLPRLFSRSVPTVVQPGLYAGSHRYVNVIGWRDQNQICLDGTGRYTVTSLSRSVEAN